MSPLFIPIRSPSHKASGQQSGPVRVQRLGLTALLSIFRPAEANCRSPLSRREKIHLLSARFADLALNCLRTIGQACRPEPSPRLSDGLLVSEIVPSRRVVFVSAYPLHLRCSPCGLRRDQFITMESPRGDDFWPETDNARR